MTNESGILPRDQILLQALSLPEDDRAFIADMLEGSLPEPPFLPSQSAAEWSNELDRRITAYLRGEVTPISFEDSVANLRRALIERRARAAQQ